MKLYQGILNFTKTWQKKGKLSKDVTKINANIDD